MGNFTLFNEKQFGHVASKLLEVEIRRKKIKFHLLPSFTLGMERKILDDELICKLQLVLCNAHLHIHHRPLRTSWFFKEPSQIMGNLRFRWKNEEKGKKEKHGS